MPSFYIENVKCMPLDMVFFHIASRKSTDFTGIEGKRADAGDFSRSTSPCAVRMGLVSGALHTYAYAGKRQKASIPDRTNLYQKRTLSRVFSRAMYCSHPRTVKRMTLSANISP